MIRRQADASGSPAGAEAEFQPIQFLFGKKNMHDGILSLSIFFLKRNAPSL
jgi:hypothetical protein